MTARPITIACRYAPTYTGGLAAYQRSLAHALGKDQGIFVAEQLHFRGLPDADEPLSWPLRRVLPRLLTRVTAPLWPRMAARPRFFSLLIRLAECGWTFPDGLHPGVVHLVDTGWHFTSFAIAHWARIHRARLSVWPAIHPGQWGDSLIDLALYQRADVLLCQSRFEANHLEKLGLPADKLAVCGLPPMELPAADPERFRARHHLQDRPLAFFLGRRTAGKGYVALLEAWQRVLSFVPHAVLAIAGTDGGAPHPGAFGIPPDSLRDLGVVSAAEKADAYAACSLFCLPSAHESFGIVFVEAWSLGKPVICGTAPASRELVTHEKTGLWADQNPEFLAEQIVRLLTNPEEARRMGGAGRAHQQQHFTIARMVEAHRRAWRI